VQEIDQAADLEAGWIVDPTGYVEQVLSNLDEVSVLYRDQVAEHVPPIAQGASERLLEGYELAIGAASEIIRILRVAPDLEAYTAATVQARRARQLFTEVRLDMPTLAARCAPGQG
jgi:hypothetical protein